MPKTQSNTKLFIYNDSRTMEAAKVIIEFELSIEQAEKDLTAYNYRLVSGKSYLSEMGKYLLKSDYNLFVFSNETKNNWKVDMITKETTELYKKCAEVMKANHFKTTNNYKIFSYCLKDGIITKGDHRRGWLAYAKETIEKIKDNPYCVNTYKVFERIIANTEASIEKEAVFIRLNNMIANETDPLIKSYLEKAKEEVMQKAAS